MPRNFLLPLIVAFALFMEGMDASVIATSLPAIALDLNENPIALKLALTSYMISLAVFIPISGWCADRFGSRTIFALAIAVFMAGSLMCAMTHTLAGFVVARFFQGLGGAMMAPVGRLILLRAVPKSDMLRALAWVMMPALLGPVVGPPLGGFITTVFHWRWIFLINLPIGLIGLVLVLRHVPNLRAEQRPVFDFVGFVLAGSGLALLMLGLTTLGGHLLEPVVAGSCIVSGTVLLGGYYAWSRHRADPVLDLDLFRIKSFRIGVVGSVFLRINSGSMPFLLPLMLQLGFHLNPLQSGLLTCTAAAGAMFMKTLTQTILRRWNFRRVLLAAALGTGAFTAAVALFSPGVPYALLVVVLLAGGCFRSLQFTAVNGIAYSDIDKVRMSRATSMVAMVQQVGQGLGVTLGASALELVAFANNVEGLPGMAEFHGALLIMGLLALGGMLVFRGLHHDDGAEVSGYRSASA